MDLSIAIPVINTVNISTITTTYTVDIHDIRANALPYTISDYTYYLFKDKQGVTCLFLQSEMVFLNKQNVFTNITTLPFYTNTNKVECLFVINITDNNDFFNIRLFI